MFHRYLIVRQVVNDLNACQNTMLGLLWKYKVGRKLIAYPETY